MENDSGHVKRLLNAIDYSIFGAMIAISALIGVFFAFFSKKKNNTTMDYLIGNKEIQTIPIAMSLAASFVSSISFLGMPAEVYMYGSQIMLQIIPTAFAVIAMMHIFMPVFWDLNIISSYEYLKRRFNNTLCLLGSGLFLIKMSLYSSAVIYAPSVALAQLSDIKLEILMPVFTVVCIAYTSIGGIRAVVWSDTLQMVLMVAGALVFSIVGIYNVGGFETIWERNNESGRIEFFNMDFDPRTRTTFWGTVFSMFFQMTSFIALNQSVAQRCLSLSTFKKTKITLGLFGIGTIFLIIVVSFNGLVAYTAFYNCDPLTVKTIKSQDQVVPYFWMLIGDNFPALPGILISALYSASFSNVSIVLNSMAGVFVIDFVKPLRKQPMSEMKTTILMKIMVVVFGCIIICLSFIIDKLGGLYQSTNTFMGMTNGPLLGIFILGMLFPWANSTGAMVGGLVSFVLESWMIVGAEIGISTGEIKYPTKPFSIEGCDNYTLHQYYETMNQTTILPSSDPSEQFPLYLVSYLHYAFIGCFVAVLVGLIVSLLTGGNDYKNMDEKLFAPVIRKFVKRKCEDVAYCDKEMEVIESCHM